MSTELIYQRIRELIDDKQKTGKLLDIGANEGNLIQKMINNHNDIECHACDYYSEHFMLKHVPFKVVNVDEECLPYKDSEFDIITASEVIEHLHNPRNLVRESYKLLKPDGLFILTTPNILNLKSRLRYLFTGFYNLFGPISINVKDKRSTHGHIMPMSYFYIYLLLFKEGFREIGFIIDKKQKSSSGIYYFFLPFMAVSKKLFIFKETKKYRTLDDSNHEIIMNMFRKNLLTGRTLIMYGIK